MAGKVIIISAPSGCGKSTIINAILAEGDAADRDDIIFLEKLPLFFHD